MNMVDQLAKLMVRRSSNQWSQIEGIGGICKSLKTGKKCFLDGAS